MRKHISVFKKEVIEALDIKPDGTYVDLTLGAGGHASAIWQQLESGTLVVFDLEKQAIDSFVSHCELTNTPQKKLIAVNNNFAELQNVLGREQLGKVDGIMADLGWSTEQLERIPGLSFANPEEELDMRFSGTGPTAADILNIASFDKLVEMFGRNADIFGSKAKKLAKAITVQRNQSSFKQVKDLLQAIEAANSAAGSALHRGSHKGPGDLPTRVFQAVRIVVNNELSTLQSMLPQAWNSLSVGGNLIIISFHSGEHRIVEEFMKARIAESAGEARNLFKHLFLHPSVDELMENMAARSAKLWGAKKLK